MRKNDILSIVYDIFSVAVITLFGTLCIVFSLLFYEVFYTDFYLQNTPYICLTVNSIVIFISVLTFVFLRLKKKLLYKIFTSIIVLLSIITICAYFLKKIGITSILNDVERFKSYINGFGVYAAVIYIIIQFLQVVVLPIPCVVTIAAGVLLFGSLKCALYSSIGIIFGSIVSFYIGKTLGYKTITRIIGKNKLDKWLKKLKGRDKFLLTFMFLFPFFPDDILCFVSGIIGVSAKFFITMICVVRVVTVFASVYSMNNSIIPYNTWWGLLLWACIFIITAVFTIFIYKKSGHESERTN